MAGGGVAERDPDDVPGACKSDGVTSKLDETKRTATPATIMIIMAMLALVSIACAFEMDFASCAKKISCAPAQRTVAKKTRPDNASKKLAARTPVLMMSVREQFPFSVHDGRTNRRPPLPSPDPVEPPFVVPPAAPGAITHLGGFGRNEHTSPVASAGSPFVGRPCESVCPGPGTGQRVVQALAQSWSVEHGTITIAVRGASVSEPQEKAQDPRAAGAAPPRGGVVPPVTFRGCVVGAT